MSTFASKYNHTSFGIDTSNYTYVKLSELYNGENGGGDYVRRIDGIFLHTSKLTGESAVFICKDDKQLVNVPKHLTEQCKEILSDTDAIDAIKNGKVGFIIYEYQSHGKNCYSVSYVDL